MGSSETLADRLLTEEKRPKLVEDAEALLDAEVERKRGARGMMIKGAYKTVKAIRRGFVRGVIEDLLDEWVAELEDFWSDWQQGGGSPSFGQHLAASSDEVAERLLRVTDRRAETTKHTTAKRLYDKLRPQGKEQVVESLPRVADLLDQHLER